jgi:superfamily II DNA/RNA helicase
MASNASISFAQLGLHSALVEYLNHAGITTPFPIQEATIPDAIAGRDVLGRGRTGSGKTLSFALPLLTRLAESNRRRQPNKPRALILVPTRELANQVNEVIMPLAKALGMFTTTIYGGVGYGGQLTALRKGVDVVVACPGRLVDHLNSRNINFSEVEVTVLDEADHMAELGFLQHVEEILRQTPEDSQRLLFSATLDRGIDRLVRNYLHNPVTHEVDSEQSPVDAMAHHVLHIRNDDRFGVLKSLCAAPGKTLVFTRTKHGAARLAEQLMKAGVPSVELHGNLSQAARARNLSAFSSGRAETLVATDIAARGIHVDDIALVIHADPPEEHKAYLHRSGRTARAGATGTVVTLMTDNQRRNVRALTKSAGIEPTTTRVTPEDDFLAELAPGERVFRESTSIVLHEERLDSPRGGGRRDGGGGGRRDGGSRGGRRDGGSRGGDRDRTPRYSDRSDAPRADRNDGPRPERSERNDGPRPERTFTPRSSGPREGAPREGGFRDRGPRTAGPREGAPREGGFRDRGPRTAGPREGAPREGGFRDRGPRTAGPRDGAPREGGFRDRGPRTAGPRDGAPRSSAGGYRGARDGAAPRSGAPRTGGPREGGFRGARDGESGRPAAAGRKPYGASAGKKRY